ncbi:MAG: hypothetical protein AABW87_02925 [Nanoarchaeota archaeon]
MPKDPDDRTGTVKFKLCTYAVPAGDENVNYYCCSQPDIMKSGKYQVITIESREWNESEGKYIDSHTEAARLGGILLGEESLDFSFERQKRKEEIIEKVLSPCVDCKFWKIRKEDLSKKLPNTSINSGSQ